MTLKSIELCGDNEQCKFDYCLTFDDDVALNTKRIADEYAHEVNVIGKFLKMYCSHAPKGQYKLLIGNITPFKTNIRSNLSVLCKYLQ